MPASVACRRCADPVPVYAASATSGFCAACKPKSEPVYQPTAEEIRYMDAMLAEMARMSA